MDGLQDSVDHYAGPWTQRQRSGQPERRIAGFSSIALAGGRKIGHDDGTSSIHMKRRTIPQHIPSYEDLQDYILEALADVRGLDAQELRVGVEITGPGTEVDSKEAEVVISMLHERLGFDLSKVKVEDLEPERMATIGALASLISEAVAA